MQINNNNISNFYKTSIGGYRMLVSADFPTSAISDLAEQYCDGVRGPFENSSSSKYANVLKAKVSFNGKHYSLYIKQYLYRSFADKLKHLFRPSRGRRALNAGAMLTECGLDSAAIVTLAEKRIGPFCKDCLLVTEDLHDAKSIYDWQDRWAEAKPTRLKYQFASQLGTVIGKMHGARIFHGDLRPGNIFAKQIESGWHFYFLDNERTIKMPILTMRRRIKNLVQINMLREHSFTNTDRFRFYRAYLKENPQLKNGAVNLARKVSEKTAVRMQKILAR